MRLPTTVVFLLTLASPTAGQSPADTTAVLLATWDKLVGSAPFRHPSGSTPRACLTTGVMGQPPDFDDLSDAAFRDLTSVLTGARSVVLVDGCHLDRSSPTFGGWIVDGDGEPAVDVELIQLRFDDADRGTVGLHVAAGGRWGTGSLCPVVRDIAANSWMVQECPPLVHR